MGQLVNGAWTDAPIDPRTAADGRYVRKESPYRKFVGKEFPAAPNRYHLYVALSCPWAHRTLMVRSLKKLQDAVSVSIAAPSMGEGWKFDAVEGGTPEHLYDERFLHRVYARADSNFTGRVTVPVLWDRESETIVNNESSEIIRMFNDALNEWGDPSVDLYPSALHVEIDAVNDRVYETVNNGVYRCGFAKTQAAYEEAFDKLFDTLDWLEERLAGQRYLVGEQLTEADIRLFATLIRFDAVYYSHFKCNKRLIIDYPNLAAYTCDLYQTPGIVETVDLHHIKHHYYTSMTGINPTGIVPKGPELDFTAPHGRESLP